MSRTRSASPTLRTKSLTTKLTEEEYARLEALVVDGQTVSELARTVLLRALAPQPFEEILLSELWALRYVLLNTVPLTVAADEREALGTAMRGLIAEADRKKAEKARALLDRQ